MLNNNALASRLITGNGTTLDLSYDDILLEEEEDSEQKTFLAASGNRRIYNERTYYNTTLTFFGAPEMGEKLLSLHAQTVRFFPYGNGWGYSVRVSSKYHQRTVILTLTGLEPTHVTLM